MPDCVLSTQNRLYVGLEPSFGEASSVSADQKIAAVNLDVRQRVETPRRRDKTGGRTFTGNPPGSRRRTEFDLTTYLSASAGSVENSAIGSLVQASLGAAPVVFPGGSVAAGSSPLQIVFGSPHGLVKGQAIGFDGEVRFVEAVISPTAVGLNAPLSSNPTAGSSVTPTVSYFPASDLPSVTIFDYWDPITAVQRIVTGSVVDSFQILVNADFHEMRFRGESQDILDSVTFTSGLAGLSSFPVEPAPSSGSNSPIPGNLGQAWLGDTAARFLTLTSARVEVTNNIDLRNREFGTRTPQCVAPGVRSVTADFELFETDDEATRSLYASARNEAPISIMFQLGEQTGQLMGAYMPSVTPTLPEFNDDERILQWNFRQSRAQGMANDELVIGLG